MLNSIEAFVDKDGKYTVKTSGTVDLKIQSDFAKAFVEHQSKVEIEKQKTEQEKIKKQLDKYFWFIVLLIVCATAAVIAAMSLIFRESDDVQKHRIDKNYELETKKIDFNKTK